MIQDDPSLREVKLSKSDKDQPCSHFTTDALYDGIYLGPDEEAERKKAAKKAQKAGSKAKKGELGRATQAQPIGLTLLYLSAAATAPVDPKKEKEEPSLPDPDPAGADYLKEVDPLRAMERLVQGMRDTPVLESWLAEFELAMRKSSLLMACSSASSVLTLHPA